jgi:hypothetical protein
MKIKIVYLSHPVQFAVLFAILLALCPYSLAQGTIQGTFVVPPGLENVEGDSLMFTGARTQQLIAQNAFAILPEGGVWLTGVSFRQDVTFSGNGMAFYRNIDINLSTTRKALSELSDDFNQNQGADNTLSFSGAKIFTIKAIPAGEPAPFDLSITFQTPFFYNPSAGSLLFDLSMERVSPSDTMEIDAVTNGPMGILRPSPAGFERRVGGTILQFEYTNVPETKTSALLLLGILAFMQLRRQKCRY